MPQPHDRTGEHGHAHDAAVGPAVLRARGRRLTRQRQLVWDALVAQSDRHLSAVEILTAVRAGTPSVNPSTVYRTLELLVEEGLVLRTDLGADRAFYEPVHEHPHHHLVCERCGAVTHVHDEVLGDLRHRVRERSGFALEAGELTLFGICPSCQHAAPERTTVGASDGDAPTQPGSGGGGGLGVGAHDDRVGDGDDLVEG